MAWKRSQESVQQYAGLWQAGGLSNREGTTEWEAV